MNGNANTPDPSLCACVASGGDAGVPSRDEPKGASVLAFTRAKRFWCVSPSGDCVPLRCPRGGGGGVCACVCVCVCVEGVASHKDMNIDAELSCAHRDGCEKPTGPSGICPSKRSCASPPPPQASGLACGPQVMAGGHWI